MTLECFLVIAFIAQLKVIGKISFNRTEPLHSNTHARRASSSVKMLYYDFDGLHVMAAVRGATDRDEMKSVNHRIAT
jgi:hypothetical protein